MCNLISPQVDMGFMLSGKCLPIDSFHIVEFV